MSCECLSIVVEDDDNEGSNASIVVYLVDVMLMVIALAILDKLCLDINIST